MTKVRYFQVEPVDHPGTITGRGWKITEVTQQGHGLAALDQVYPGREHAIAALAHHILAKTEAPAMIHIQGNSAEYTPCAGALV